MNPTENPTPSRDGRRPAALFLLPMQMRARARELWLHACSQVHRAVMREARAEHRVERVLRLLERAREELAAARADANAWERNFASATELYQHAHMRTDVPELEPRQAA